MDFATHHTALISCKELFVTLEHATLRNDPKDPLPQV